ncbi:mitotic checkpoint regulator, MAD2B-interacting-domain-containing protein [Phaeosphaeria sp. MPI-PUGE-AT-0046c]|nr:mitotic checkpoint regulator, MAD2B-interacting-domain-containing protein [Phaeosphaeria sp. MPI-PUGE-AT-0046c]
MNLIAYSDSESDGEAPPAPKPALKQAPKATFQKVVDRSNPGRIKVNLPGASQTHADRDDIEADAPPAKKARLGGGAAFGGFNAMLPAPKKPAATASSASAAPGKKPLGKGLAAGVNLRTGAEPAFKRESRVETEEYDENGNPVKKEPMKKEDFRALLNLPTPKSEQKQKGEAKPEGTVDKNMADAIPAPKAAAPRFVPMSVGKGKKKKPVIPRAVVASPSTSGLAASPAQPSTAPAPPPRKPKVSLFGTSQANTASPTVASEEAYKPMLYGAEDDDGAPVPDAAFDEQFHNQPAHHIQATPSSAPSNDLSGIASELNLSEAERRQLFGKRGREADFSSAKIVTFNTDTEYAHNEKLRQQGEQVQHNALKSISGTGKNSLRSLINVASTQKDALEEHFASGYRNKKEAGNKYGW